MQHQQQDPGQVLPQSNQTIEDSNSFHFQNDIGFTDVHASHNEHQRINQNEKFSSNGSANDSSFVENNQEFVGLIHANTSSEASKSSLNGDDDDDNDNFDEDGENEEEDDGDEDDDDEDENDGGKTNKKAKNKRKRALDRNDSNNDDESDYENDGDDLSPGGTSHQPRKKKSGERSSSSANSKIRRGNWSKEEDKMLLDAIATYDFDWKMISLAMGGRTSKQCRDRYKLKLDPSINHGPWTKEEDIILLKLHEQFGRQWTKIASALPGRTENSVKTRFSSLVKLKSKEWTEEEDLKLREARKTETPFSEIAAKILPNRSEHAVKKRWEQLFMRDLAQKIREELPPNIASTVPKTFGATSTGTPNATASPSTPLAKVEQVKDSLMAPSVPQMNKVPVPSQMYAPSMSTYSSDNNSMTTSFQGQNDMSIPLGNNFDQVSYMNNAGIQHMQEHHMPVNTEFPPPSMPILHSTNNQDTDPGNNGSGFQPPSAQPRRSQRLQRHSTSMTVLLQLLGDHPGS